MNEPPASAADRALAEELVEEALSALRCLPTASRARLRNALVEDFLGSAQGRAHLRRVRVAQARCARE